MIVSKSSFFRVMALVSLSAAASIVTEPIEGGGTALVVSGTAFTTEEAAALTGNTVQELWKTGSSTLTATGIAAFTGPIRVKGGVYKMTEVTGWGATSAKLYVENGGTLYTTAGDANKEVHIAGAGSGSYPALVKNGAAMKLVMDDDASIAFYGSWISLASTLDMGEHTLTVKYCGDHSSLRSEGVWPKASNISNAGNLVIDGAVGSKLAKLTFTYNSDQLQGTNHTITVRNGDADWYLTKKKSNWKLVYENNASFGYGSTAADMKYDVSWDGPIEVKSGVTLKVKPNLGMRAIFRGPISGAGALVLSPDVTGDVYFSGTNTAYTGNITITMGTLHVTSESGITAAQVARTTFGSNAAMILEARSDACPDGFTAAAVKDIIEAKPTGAVAVGVDEGVVFDYPYAMPVDFRGYLASYGPGIVRVNVEMDRSKLLRLSAVTNIMVTAGADADTRVSSPTNITVNRGRVTMADAGVFSMATELDGGVVVTGNQEPYPELVITGKTVFAKAEGANNPVVFAIGNGGNRYGRIEF